MSFNTIISASLGGVVSKSMNRIRFTSLRRLPLIPRDLQDMHPVQSCYVRFPLKSIGVIGYRSKLSHALSEFPCSLLIC